MRLLLLLLLLLSASDARNRTAVPAAACLDNADCLTHAPCAPHQLSQPGSLRCCPRARACARGHAVDGHTCLCTPMRCAAPQALAWRPQGRLQCVATYCPPCRGGQALDSASCACVAVPRGRWWWSGHGVLERIRNGD